MEEATLKKLFNESQERNADKLQFTPEEAEKFKKSFEDPEFRKLFADYIDELQNPEYRAETEAYISQLEGEQKVPEGKELIRPSAGFVAKTHKTEKGSSTKDKIFLNIVSSEKINEPSSTKTKDGSSWSVPYSLGPPHMEKDKSGENVPCFDCCFHPRAIELSKFHKEFKELLVHTAMEGVEEMYKRQKQEVKLAREFHVVKGMDYKSGQIPTMMIPLVGKEKWKEEGPAKPESKKKAEGTKKHVSFEDPGAGGAVSSSSSPNKGSSSSRMRESQPGEGSPSNDEDNLSFMSTPDGAPAPTTAPNAAAPKAPAIKKGFLSSAKSGIYDDKLTTIRKKSSGTPSGHILTAATAPPVEQNDGGSLVLPGPSGRTDKVQEYSGTSSQKTTSPPVEKSRAIEDEPALKELSTVIKPRQLDLPAATGPVAPRYTVKERGNVGLGDFESMRAQQVGSSRPSELVYTFDIPLVAKASQITLDVAERHLVLRYLDVYDVTVTLPYPVFDKKGDAKYDKGRKTLTVTIPVKPAAAVSVVSSAPVQEERNVQEVVREEPIEHSARTAPQRTGDSHNRWVDKPSESESLKREIEEQARAAVEKFKLEEEAAKSRPPANTLSSSDNAVKQPETTPRVRFIASPTFQGEKPGYVFHLSAEGLGYYLDSAAVFEGARNDEIKSNKETERSAQPDPAAAAEGRRMFDYDFQQTKQALSLLIQVPFIRASTVQISYTKDGVSMMFDACEDAASDPASEEKSGGEREVPESSVRVVKYGMALQLNAARTGDGLDVSKCRFDVAGRNMVVVLWKATEDYWEQGTDKEDHGLFTVRRHHEEFVEPKSSKVGDKTSTSSQQMKSFMNMMSNLSFASEVAFELD